MMMNATEFESVEKLIDHDWLDVKAMIHPAQPNPHVLLYVVFSTECGAIALTGKPHTVQDEMLEAFSLTVHLWWAENERGETVWKPIPMNLRERGAYASLMKAPREVRFYSDPRLRLRRFPKKFVLDDCSAIEFLKTVNGETERLVIRASDDSPCEVEIGTTLEECDRLLKGLEPLQLPEFCNRQSAI
jgi:hypothetical protein